jgi:hypothetical protein
MQAQIGIKIIAAMHSKCCMWVKQRKLSASKCLPNFPPKDGVIVRPSLWIALGAALQGGAKSVSGQKRK